MKRLLLISPLAHHSLLGADFHFRMPCLSLLKVAALTPPDWSVRILDEKVEKMDGTEQADLVGITGMTCSAPRAYEIADRFRARGIPVVMGGIHASSMPDEALRHCDSVLVGEAEGLWTRILHDAVRDRLQPLYRHRTGFPSLANLPPVNWDYYRGKGYLPSISSKPPVVAPWIVSFALQPHSSGGGIGAGRWPKCWGNWRI